MDNPLITATRKLRGVIEKIESTGLLEVVLSNGRLAIAWDDCGFKNSHLILDVMDPNAKITQFDPREFDQDVLPAPPVRRP